MRPDPVRVAIIAAEASADMHGAALARSLRVQHPALELAGIGGEHLRQAGVTTWADLTPYAAIGFSEIVRHLGAYRRVFRSILEHLAVWQPAAVVLIDFPGFNLRLATAIKKQFPHINIIYYISPQVWAWGQRRVQVIRRVVDKMIVLFKFEQDFYRRHGIAADFVGHPLLDEVRTTVCRERMRASLHISPGQHLIAVLPGSRAGEIKRLLPLMTKAAAVLRRHLPNTRFAVIKAAHLPDELFVPELRRWPHEAFSLISHDRYDVIAASDFAWVCSGTATLETAILGTPMVVVYRTSLLTWLISRSLIKLPYIGLVNLAAGANIMPELIQFRATPRNLCRLSADFLLSCGPDKQKKRAQLEAVRALLEPHHAADQAADRILTMLVTESRYTTRHDRRSRRTQ